MDNLASSQASTLSLRAIENTDFKISFFSSVLKVNKMLKLYGQGKNPKLKISLYFHIYG